MANPARFPMRRMLLAVALLSIAAIVFSLAARDAYNFNPALWGLSFIAGGAGIGTIAGRPILGATWGLLLAVAVGVFATVILRA